MFPLVTRTAPYTTREDKHRMPGTVAVLERDELFELIMDAYRFGFTHAVLGSVDLETHTRIVSEQE